MKWILSLALIAAASIASAATAESDPSQFTGSWSGNGVYLKNGVRSLCSTFEMKFEGNRYLMNFLGGSRTCEFHTETFASVAMAHVDGVLYYNGMKVGTIKDNIMESNFSMPEGNGHVRHWRMSMRKEGNNMVYEESRTMDNETTPLISFTGILSKTK